MSNTSDYPQTVRAVIQFKDRYLFVQHHYMSPSNMGKWSMPGGRIAPEDPDRESTLRRELREEFKLEVEIVRFIDSYTFREVQHHIYHVRTDTADLTPDPVEIVAVRWFTLAELDGVYTADKLFAPFMLEAVYAVQQE